ncbi:12967_t:CDS:1 [Funneliformis geosporum]|uniref:12967_t:CDS:1 n=1 Tax=Funneliformis geosporum TaxID=1117311 RepID=A0A9W4SDN9_9GLOM|nr:12967_t:CDS:1 [Funneliformis geosporum]
MLTDTQFKPDSRPEFTQMLNSIRAGSQITIKNLGQQPKNFTEGYQGEQFFITKQMMDIWEEFDADSKHSIKKVLSGPVGVGKSYIAWFLAANAYANSWLTLYVADASELDTYDERKTVKQICQRFFALNKDILTSTDFELLLEFVNYYDQDTDNIIGTCFSTIFAELLKTISRKTLLIIDDHGALFDGEIPVPDRLPSLAPLKYLTFWGESMKGTRVVYTGTAHARFEKVYLKNGMQDWVIYVAPMLPEIFEQLLIAVSSRFHSTVRNYVSIIKEEVLKITNCVPRELNVLARMIGTGPLSLDEVRETMKRYEINRRSQFYNIARTYYDSLPTISKNETRLALADIFLPGKTRNTSRFEWKFLDFGLIYRIKDVKDESIELHKIICPSAKEALLDLYKNCPLPEAYLNSLARDNLDGAQFEDILFQQLMKLPKLVLKTTDIAGKNEFDLSLDIKGFDLLKKSSISYDKDVLVRCYVGYPRYDFILGYMFFQVSISDFVTHNTGYANIDLSFNQRDSDGKNQIENYLDGAFGGIHKAEINETTAYIKNKPKTHKKFVVSKNDKACDDFKIIYICGSPGKVNHIRKVDEYPEVLHISYDEIKLKMFGLSLFSSK